MDRDEAVRKLKLLLEVNEERGASPAESARAARMAQHMINKYELQEAMIAILQERAEGGACMHSFSAKDMLTAAVYQFKNSRTESWILYLSNQVCVSNGCKSFYVTGRRGVKAEIKAIGRPQDLQWAILLMDHFTREIESYAITYRYGDEYTGDGKSEINSFKLGMQSEICRRLREADDETKQERATTREFLKESGDSSLALISIAELRLDKRLEIAEEVMSTMKMRAGGRRSAKISGSAYSSGVQAGKNVSLSPNRRIK